MGKSDCANEQKRCKNKLRSCCCHDEHLTVAISYLLLEWRALTPTFNTSTSDFSGKDAMLTFCLLARLLRESSLLIYMYNHFQSEDILRLCKQLVSGCAECVSGLCKICVCGLINEPAEDSHIVPLLPLCARYAC